MFVRPVACSRVGASTGIGIFRERKQYKGWIFFASNDQEEFEMVGKR